MNLLVLSSHAILEYDDLRLFSRLGYDVFIPGAYSDPAHPGVEFGREPFRPPILDAPHHPELEALCHAQRVKHADTPAGMGVIDWAKADLHPDLIDWADVIMVNCFPVEWISGQWDRIRHKRVIWRTIGQSNPWVEHEMKAFRTQGMEIVRYSPAERRAFEPTGAFAGEDAIIRFAKDPADYGPWIGDEAVVGNVTQNLDVRGDHCGLPFWTAATEGLPVKLAGLGSERMGGVGSLSWNGLRDYLAHIRVFLYTGTQPASYTLGLMEAMLTGTPILSIGPEEMWMPALFEAHEMVGWADVEGARQYLAAILATEPAALMEQSAATRAKGIELFGIETVGRQWLAFLGAPVVRELVTV
jgi:hypothetical protein